MNVKEFSIHVFHCSIIKVLLFFDSHDRLSYLLGFVKHFFSKVFYYFYLFSTFETVLQRSFPGFSPFLLLLSPTAILDYHSHSSLSTTFFIFFHFFQPLFSTFLQPLFSPLSLHSISIEPSTFCTQKIPLNFNLKQT